MILICGRTIKDLQAFCTSSTSSTPLFVFICNNCNNINLFPDKSCFDPYYWYYWYKSCQTGRKTAIVCISRFMNDYAYQIKGALEDAQGHFLGLRVLVCDKNNFEIVDVPVEVIDAETARYLEFRLKVTDVMDVRRLPYGIQNKIRAPLGRWLDRWVLDNFYGYTSNREGTNP